VRGFTDDQVARMDRALAAMREHAEAENVERWQSAHRDFHRVLVSRANDQFGRTIAAYQDRSERYWLMFIRTSGTSGGLTMRDAEHRAIADAARARQPSETALLLARHLSRTALTLMAQLAPEHEPLTVRTALQFVTGRSGDLA
jgi:DNA-binding GntR family transcriptional regulator